MRRPSIALAGSALLACGLAACGGTSDNSASSVSLKPTTAGGDSANVSGMCAGTPRTGGSLVYARQSETQVLNPLEVRNGNGDIFAQELLFNGLVRSDPRGSFDIQPALADRWTISKDGRTYTFHLRPGVRFSNGQPVTTDDVKFSLDRFADPRVNTVLAAAAAGYDRTDIIDDATVAVHLRHPVAGFLYNISIFPAVITPKSLVEREGRGFWNKPVGTGPFTVSDFVRGSHITFRKNPNYWENGKPYLDQVRFDFATDSNTRLLSLKNGQAQIADGVPFSQIGSVQGTRGLQIQAVRAPLFVGLWMNNRRPGMDDVNVRQAMQYALDKDEINKAIFHGVGTSPNSVLPQFKFDGDDSQVAPYRLDLAKAKQLMSQSRYPDGFETTLQYPAGYDYYKQLGLFLQQSWAQLGIRVKLIEQDQATESQRFYPGDFDMTFPYAQFTSDVVVPDEYAQFVADPSNGLHGFYSWWSDPQVTSMVRQFTSSTSDAERAKLWPQIQRAMMVDSPWINVMDLPFVNAHADSVCNTTVNALGADHLENTWLAQ
ncbi:MAG TPA: ABC transporter substrate-binding protein [Conexibacter sp.]|jgi:peptide/nickel transport system substrate-binding protein